MSDDIHKTHFQVPEMPWREKEKQAILLFQKLIPMMIEEQDSLYNVFPSYEILTGQKEEYKDLVEWVMKYKGE